MGEEKESGLERYIQLIAGLFMWGYLMYTDHNREIDLLDMSTGDITIQLLKYTFAAVLIKGVTVKEITDLLKAWKSK